jgi:cobalt-zinc-cadmium efflux system outer membrane protein
MLDIVQLSGYGGMAIRKNFFALCRGVMMGSLSRFVFVFLLGGWCFAAAGAEPAAGPVPLSSDLGQLTLRQAEIFFAARNRELQFGRRLVEGAEADRLSAGQRPNPNLYLNATQIGHTYPPGYDASGANRRADMTVGLNQLFERGNKRELRMGAADSNVVASRGDLADIQRQQKVVLYAAYYDLVAAQERVRITNETAESFRKTMDAVERRLKAGDISAADVERIRVDALRAQNDARTAQADRAKAQTALAYVIGTDRDAASINAADGWPALQSAATAVDIDRILAGRADVQAAQARIAAAEKNRELARSLRTRDVTAMVQFDRTPWSPDSNLTSANTLGFGVSMPLFTSYYYEGEIRRAEVDLDSARENYERVRAVAVGEIAAREADLSASRERVLRFRDALTTSAQKAADAAEFAYSRGAIGVMDLLDSRRQLYATRLEASASQADYAKSLAAFQAAVAAAEVRGDEKN